MSNSVKETRTEVVYTQISLRSLLDNIANLPTDSPSLFCGLEGSNVGRRGSVSILSLFVVPRNTAYLVDVHQLGSDAFTATNDNKISLKTILESPSIPKAYFDVRNISDALLSLHYVSLSGAKDIQLMELAYRPGSFFSKKYVAALADCVAQCSRLSDAQKREWERVGKGTARLSDHQKRGTRPLEKEFEQYCVQHVTVLPKLHDMCDNKLRQPGETFWQVEVQHATKERIKLSQKPQYDAQSKDNNLGPWSESYIEGAIEEWNEEVMFEAMHGDEARDWENELEDHLDGVYDNDDEEYDNYDDYQDTARDCIGWEEDMIKN